MLEEPEDIFVPIENELEDRIVDVFNVFDHAGSKSVDTREVGTIIRALGCCPTEADVQELAVNMEAPGHPGSVHLIRFLPAAAKAVTEHKFEPASPDVLLEAFNVLDAEGRGYLTKERMIALLTQDGEPFNQDELEEMLEVAVDPQTQTIPYEYYINQLMFEPCTEETNIYMLADRIEREKPPPPTVKRFSQMFADMAALI